MSLCIYGTIYICMNMLWWYMYNGGGMIMLHILIINTHVQRFADFIFPFNCWVVDGVAGVCSFQLFVLSWIDVLVYFRPIYGVLVWVLGFSDKTGCITGRIENDTVYTGIMEKDNAVDSAQEILIREYSDTVRLPTILFFYLLSLVW